MISSVIKTPQVSAGQPVILMHNYERTAYCRVDLDRFLINEDDQLVRRERLPAGTTLIGLATRELSISTVDLPPGNYTLRELLHSDCGDRLHTQLVPDSKFTVVP